MSDPAIDAVEVVVDSYFDTGVTPGLAYGVVEEDRLAHGGGRGRTGVDERTPDAESVFRIASMTKSFTAAAVLSLRDEGHLLLDVPAEEYVPELAGLTMPTADSPRLTVRHLLTMSGGLPTDDAWGDRQESLTDEEFGDFLQAGFRFDSTPGTQFEYSNLGFAVLGRVVATVADESYRDFVTRRLLRPLGLTRSVFDSASASPHVLVRGHRRVDDQWQQEEFDKPGAFSPIGGLYSSVADLTRWVSGLAAAFPARDDPPTTIRSAEPAGGRCSSSTARYRRQPACPPPVWWRRPRPGTASGSSSTPACAGARSSATRVATPVSGRACAGIRPAAWES